MNTNNKIASLPAYIPQPRTAAHILDANESPFGLSASLAADIAAAAAAVEYNRYPDPYAQGLLERYAAFSGINADNLTAGNGSDELIGIIIAAYLTKGEKMLIFSPDFSMYAFYAKLYEVTPVICEKTAPDDFAVDFDRAARMVKEHGIKLVILSSPCNPTGQAVDREAFLAFIRDTDALVVADEAYIEYAADPASLTLAGEVVGCDNLIVLRTLSKLGFAALRLGFAAGAAANTAILRKVKSPYNVNALSAAAGECVLNRAEEIWANVRRVRQIKAGMYSALKNILPFDEGYRLLDTEANFLVITAPNAAELHARLTRSGVLTRTVGENLLRVTVGSEQSAEALNSAMKAYFRE